MERILQNDYPEILQKLKSSFHVAPKYEKWLLFQNYSGSHSSFVTHFVISYVDNFAPAGQYRTSTKEENGTFSNLETPESSNHRHFPS